ncbi:Hsp33 family molecular chaperone HslO [Elioraea sp.]|jgi:molecular chaperone Hsp33|uniref:Hsp33 family molecular chaperone HslO n=1 Tax=Elioraea sp. TaxID=2185103 RepID=UPI0021DC67A9|nr:Hsp33 family molecular chaperone HslO [Elioraea sp.]GIX09087.1 MAG: 33 kDa chaperonin [Elioraea sp.]
MIPGGEAEPGRAPVPILTVPSAVRPFYLEAAPARGQLVRLGPLADALLTRHALPDAVAQLLGEALALTAGLAAALKFEGSFSLQARGDGPVGMLLADCTGRGALRGYARIDAAALARFDGAPSAARLLGAGHLAFTVDQGPEMDRYQGIVPLEGSSLADLAHTWFRTSQQVEAAVKLVAARTPAGWRASALLLERIAFAGGGRRRMPEDDDEAWRTAVMLAGSATGAELLDEDLPAERLLWRLFHELDPRIQHAKPVSFGCRCSRERIERVLAGFGPAELDQMAEDGAITVTCEFCNVDFRFDRGDVGAASPADGGAA